MKKSLIAVFSLVLLTMISRFSFAGFKVVDCILVPDSYPAVQSFFVTESNKTRGGAVNCGDSEGHDYKVAFTGLGAGLEVSAFEGLKLAYTGLSDDIVGTYYGLRASASAGVGVNTILAWGNWGQLSVLGGDLLALGASASVVKVIVGKTWEEVRKALADDDEGEE